MSRYSFGLPEALRDYYRSVCGREPPVLAALREETRSLPMAGMQISPELGSLLTVLVKLSGARRCLEVGTFTGYSSTAVALALPADGTLHCCDVNPEWTAIARRYWEKAGVAGKITLTLAPAAETLDRLIAEGGAGRYDFCFVDADKTGYDAYYERALTLLRPGGLIAFDNVLWGGSVADPERNDPDTMALKALNAKIVADPRVEPAMIPIGDGVTLALKR